ncbi:hypothetical protein Gogos_010592, partial [Gossypium gossypioides]|nr:hypothetical protein [Gossypium gossypioides]
MANLWHPVKGVQIRDLGEKRYIFKFFHIVDMEIVIKGSPWTFNNHLLVLHKLQWREDPLRVLLISASFWVQVHDVSISFYSENLAIQLGNFIGIFQEYDSASLGKENMNFMRIRIQIDIRRPLKRKNKLSFRIIKIEAGVEIGEMGWDLSLRAQSRRAQAMSSVWLREEGGYADRNNRDELKGNRDWRKARKFESIPDPILGFNLEGKGFSSGLGGMRKVIDNNHMAMEHDLENEVVVCDEGKKRVRGDIEESNEMGGRNRRKAE